MADGCDDPGRLDRRRGPAQRPGCRHRDVRARPTRLGGRRCLRRRSATRLGDAARSGRASSGRPQRARRRHRGCAPCGHQPGRRQRPGGRGATPMRRARREGPRRPRAPRGGAARRERAVLGTLGRGRPDRRALRGEGDRHRDGAQPQRGADPRREACVVERLGNAANHIGYRLCDRRGHVRGHVNRSASRSPPPLPAKAAAPAAPGRPRGPLDGGGRRPQGVGAFSAGTGRGCCCAPRSSAPAAARPPGPANARRRRGRILRRPSRRRSGPRLPAASARAPARP